MKTNSFFILAFLGAVSGAAAQEFTSPMLLLKNNQHAFSFLAKHDAISAGTFQDFGPIPKNIVLDSIYIWRTDAEKKTGKLVDIEYNTAKHILSGIFKKLQNSNWENVSKYEYGYDANNNEIHFLQKDWEGNTWINKEQEIKTYNGNNLETMIQQQWDPSAASWESLGKLVYTYDTNGNLVIEESNPWNGSSFEPAIRFITTYDAQDRIQTKTGQSYSNSVWADVFKEFFTYDAKGNLLQILAQDKDTNLNWRNSSKQESTYDAGSRLLTETMFHWDISNSTWQEIQKSSAYNWDLNNNLIAYKTEGAMSGTYLLLSSYQAAYNSVNQLTDEAVSIWENNNTLDSKDSTHYFIHSSSNGIADVKTGKNSILIYPNPSNGTFSILTENKRAVKTIEVYNIVGERVLQQRASSQVTLGNIPSGIYFVKVDDGTTVYTTKITIH